MHKPSELNDLREQLRRLGYLDSRLGRFFLPKRDQERSFFSAVLRSAAKLGLSGGVLLAVPLLIGGVASTPQLAGMRLDLFVVSFYCFLGAGLTIFLLALLVGAVLSLAHRSGLLARVALAPLARRVGLVVGLVSLGYLTLWWRSRVGSGLVWSATLGLGVIASLALARLTTLAALGMLSEVRGNVAAGQDRESIDRQRASSLKMRRYLLAGAVCYLSLFLLIGRAAENGEAAFASPYQLQESPYRVVFLGVDGLSLSTIEALREQGELPALEKLLELGMMAPIRPAEERVPAVLWTSLATGQRPERHGIRALSAESMPGLQTTFQFGETSSFGRAVATMRSLFRLTKPRPVGTRHRQVKAIWDILSDQGRAVGVVGWWASWPADPLRGFLISDRLFFKLREGDRFEGETDDLSLYRRLQSEFEAAHQRSEENLGSLVAQARSLGGEELLLAYQRDGYHLQVGEMLREEQAPDLYMTYLSALDVTAMKLLGEPSGDVGATIGATGLIRQYGRWLNAWLERWIEKRKPDEVLVLVAQPGRHGDARSARGALYVAGAPIDPQAEAAEVSIYDVSPTLLHLLGFPNSQEIEGDVLTTYFTDDWTRSHPLERIQTYGRRRIDPRLLVTSGFDEEMIRNLQTLGYIE